MNPELIVYARVSSSKQIHGTSLSTQTNKKLIESVSEELDLPFNGKVYQDKGVSAHKGKHLEGEFGSLLNDINTGVVHQNSVILVFNLDRMGRDELLAASVRFQSLLLQGVRIYTSMDRRLYSKDSPNLMADLMISLTIMQRAWEESETKRTRTNNALQEAITDYHKDGKYTTKVGVSPIFIDHKTGKLNSHAPAFRYIVDSLLSGSSVWDILQHLNKNYPAPRKAWTQASVYKIAKKVPEYLLGHKVFNFNGHEQRLENLYEPLVTLDEYNRLKVLSGVSERKSPTRKQQDIFLLSGILKCNICNGGMISFRKSPTITNCVCSAAQKGESPVEGEEKHSKEVFPLPVLEALTCFMTQDYINQRKLTQEEGNTNQTVNILEGEISKYKEAIKGLEEELEEDYSPSLAKALKSYESKLKTASERLQEVLTGLVDTSSIENTKWLTDCLRDTTNTERNNLKVILNQVIEKVVVRRRKWSKERVIAAQAKAKSVGSEREYWHGLKGDYYVIDIKVIFKAGGTRWLSGSPIMIWNGKQSVSFSGDDTTGDNHISIKGMQKIKEGIRELGLVGKLVISKGNFRNLGLH